MSGLVMPGLGQWTLGRKLRGGLMMAWVVLLLIAMAVRISALVNAAMPEYLEPSMVVPVFKEVFELTHRQAYVDNWWLFLPLVIIWIGSAVDAYFLTRDAPDENAAITGVAYGAAAEPPPAPPDGGANSAGPAAPRESPPPPATPPPLHDDKD